MNRSEFLRCMAAVFCGTLLPEPVRELIRAPTTSELIVNSVARGDGWDAYMIDYTSSMILDVPKNTRAVGIITSINPKKGHITINTPLQPVLADDLVFVGR